MRDRVVDTPPTGHVAHIVATDYEAPDLNKETRYQLLRTARCSLTCWSFSFMFLAWMMNPLKVELSEVESWRLILPPGTTRSELRRRLAGEGPVCAGWLWPGVMAGG